MTNRPAMPENITSYVAQERRGFDEKPVSDVDLLAFAALTYMEFERYPRIAEDEPPIGELGKYGPLWSLAEHDCNPTGMTPLLEALVASPRFQGIRIRRFACDVDERQAVQFGAACYPVTADTTVVVFRGTDMKHVGWREDFRMIGEGATPGQEDSLDYLREVARDEPSQRLIVCGHSKGGANAEYATVFADDELQARIDRAVSFDGPALYRLGNNDCPELLAYDGIVRERYRRLHVPLTRYLFAALVGLMFEPPESDESGRPFVESVDPKLTHNVCSARIVDGEFVRATPTAKQLKAGFKTSRWVRQLDWAERVAMPDFLVDAFEDAGVPIDLSLERREVLKVLQRRYRHEPPRIRAIVRSAARKLARA